MELENHKYLIGRTNNRIYSNTLISVVLLLVYKLLIDYAYDSIIFELFEYQNYYRNPSICSIFFSWIFYLSLLPLIISNLKKKTLSSRIVTLFCLLSLVPTTTFILFNSDYSNYYLLLIYIYWLIFLVVNYFVPQIKLPTRVYKESSLTVNMAALVLSSAIIYISFVYTGLRFHFNLMTVYDIREEARDFQINRILGYLSTFADNILPILLVYFLVKRKLYLTFLVIFAILLNFGISGIKQVLFLLLFSIIIFLVVKRIGSNNRILLSLICLVGISILEFKVFSTWFIALFSLYRVLFIPVKLHYLFYDFFSSHEKDYFRQTLFKWFFDSPYKVGIDFMIGEIDTGLISTRANNGLFSDAYSNLGVFGVIILPLVIVLILRLLDTASKGLEDKILLIVIITVTFLFINLPISTALVSGGLIPIIIILFTMPRRLSNQQINFLK